jgi:hypothetical protein
MSRDTVFTELNKNGMMVSAATLTKTRIPMEKLMALVDGASGRL